jgi:hypothetical protein
VASAEVVVETGGTAMETVSLEQVGTIELALPPCVQEALGHRDRGGRFRPRLLTITQDRRTDCRERRSSAGWRAAAS